MEILAFSLASLFLGNFWCKYAAMMMTVAVIAIEQKPLMLHMAHLHARKANHFQVSSNAPIVVRTFY